MYRGSRKHVLDWIESNIFLPELLELVKVASPKVTHYSRYAPLGYRNPDEARLEKWCPNHFGNRSVWEDLHDWWLVNKKGANTPNWDIVLIVEIENKKGLILVEAKANVPELDAGGKSKPSNSEASRQNHDRIGEAIEGASEGLSSIASQIAIGRDTHYQLSNRLAYTWKIASLGIPVILLYLGFLGDTGITNVGSYFTDSKHWESEIAKHFSQVGADGLLCKRFRLTGAPFWILQGSREIIQISP
ncbi:MAG: hypothetical protein ACXQTE_06030 [Methanosarcinaceae archaeon]